MAYPYPATVEKMAHGSLIISTVQLRLLITPPVQKSSKICKSYSSAPNPSANHELEIPFVEQRQRGKCRQRQRQQAPGTSTSLNSVAAGDRQGLGVRQAENFVRFPKQ